jgi:ABC-type sugar transport system ATPase subunit
MVSHNMSDVQAVADQVCVLRLGRNNGVFKMSDVTTEDIVAAITGADDNAHSRRATKSAEKSAAAAADKEAEPS